MNRIHKKTWLAICVLLLLVALPLLTACTKEVVKEVPVEKVVTQEVVKEIPVEKEVIKEVPKEVIKEVPVEKVVEKEVVREVTVTATVAPAPKPEPPAKVYKLKFADYGGPTGSRGSSEEWLLDQIEERSNGQIEFERFYSQSLLKAVEILPGTASGIADLGVVSISYFPAQFPLHFVSSLLYLADGPYAMAQALTDLSQMVPEFKKEAENVNIVPIAYYTTPRMIIATNKRVDTMEDLVGLKMRAVGLGAKALGDLGVSVVSMSAGEIGEAIQRGTLNSAGSLPFYGIRLLNLHESLKYIIDPGFGAYSAAIIGMNKNVWEGLPEHLQEVILEVGREYPTHLGGIFFDKDVEDAKLMKEDGVIVYELSDEEAARWKDKVLPDLYEDWLDDVNSQGLPGDFVLETYKVLLKKYAADEAYDWKKIYSYAQ